VRRRQQARGERERSDEDCAGRDRTRVVRGERIVRRERRHGRQRETRRDDTNDDSNNDSNDAADDRGRDGREARGCKTRSDRRSDDCREARTQTGREAKGSSELRRRNVLGRSKKEVSIGIGFRWELMDELFALPEPPKELDFFEICPENFMRRGGAIPAALERISRPILTHGLTMSLGGSEPLSPEYLRELSAFIARVRSPWHSDHLCFGVVEGRVLHDLLPLAFTEETARRVADRVKRAEDAIGVPMAVENISFYAHPGKREMSEPEFVTRVCDLADCALMLDVNNAYVNAQNFGFDADEWMRNAPLERTVQIHVAGHERFEDFVDGVSSIILDTHGAPVCDPVLALLERVLPRTGRVPIVLERDTKIPPLDDLLAEARILRGICDRVFGAKQHAALAEVRQ